MSETIILEVNYDDEEDSLDFTGAYPILSKDVKIMLVKQLILLSGFEEEEIKEILAEEQEE